MICLTMKLHQHNIFPFVIQSIEKKHDIEWDIKVSTLMIFIIKKRKLKTLFKIESLLLFASHVR